MIICILQGNVKITVTWRKEGVIYWSERVLPGVLCDPIIINLTSIGRYNVVEVPLVARMLSILLLNCFRNLFLLLRLHGL